jgi:hypothetical protein
MVVESKKLREQLSQEVMQLPTRNLIELLHFVNYLKYRDKMARTSGPTVALEGIWKDIPFDITADDVRALRQQVTQTTKEKLDAILD